MRAWWLASGARVIFIAMIFTPMGMLTFCAARDAMEREQDAIARRCQQIARADQVCPMTSVQKAQFDRERRESEDEARWDREAKRILGQ